MATSTPRQVGRVARHVQARCEPCALTFRWIRRSCRRFAPARPRLSSTVRLPMQRVPRWLTVLGLKLRRFGSAARPMLIQVPPGSYEIHGLNFETGAELESFLLVFKPKHVRLLPTKLTTYEHVAVAMRALQRVGADISMVGNVHK